MLHSSVVGERIFRNYQYLNSLRKSRSNEKRSKLLDKAQRDQLLAIVEIALNLLKAKIHLSNKQKNRLIPYANLIRKIARARSEKTARRLVQQGGSLSLIPVLLAPVLAEVARSLIAGKDG